MTQWIPTQQYQFIVEHMPIVTVDVLLKNQQHQYLLGRRKNKPAQGFYFTPGGRVQKNETLSDSIQRVLSIELGLSDLSENYRLVGAYDHIYSDNAWDMNEFGTHCVNLLYGRKTPMAIDLTQLSLSQHESFQLFSIEEILRSREVHDNVKMVFLNSSRENLHSHFFTDK